MFCKNCGTQFEGAFCTNCGTAAEVAPVVAEEAPAVEYVAPEMTTPAEDPGKGKGTAAMILGIISLVISVCCTCLFPAGIVCAIISLVQSKQATELAASVGMENKNAKIGKILSIISLVLMILAVVGVLLVYALEILVYGVAAFSSY